MTAKVIDIEAVRKEWALQTPQMISDDLIETSKYHKKSAEIYFAEAKVKIKQELKDEALFFLKAAIGYMSVSRELIKIAKILLE